MTVKEAVRLAQSVQYKPGFTVKTFVEPNYLTVTIRTPKIPDATKPGQMLTLNYGRKIHMHDACYDESGEYFRQWLADLFLAFERHERDEWLRIDGKQIHDPHEEA